MIIATAPFFAALLSRVFLGEPILRRTWVAIGVVIGAVVGGLGTEASRAAGRLVR